MGRNGGHRNRIKIVLAYTLIALAAGCQLTRMEEPEIAAEEPVYERADELFVSERGEDGVSRTVFRTNEEKYARAEGLTVWTVYGEAEEEFKERRVKMGKASGYAGGGYGIVICQGEYEVRGKKEPVMLAVMVNNEGQYIIGKAVGGVYRDFGWWKANGSLRKGMGAENELRVSYEEESGEYLLEINGDEAERFQDESEPEVKGGKNGYIAVVTPYDKFPESGIDVYFEEQE